MTRFSSVREVRQPITATNPKGEEHKTAHNLTMKFSAALCLAGASTIGAFAPNAFVGRSNTATSVAVGDSLPEIELFQGFPDPKKINLAEYAKDKNMIILSLPGAFTPT